MANKQVLVSYGSLGCLSGYYGTPCRPCDLSGCATRECQPLDGSCACGSVPYNTTSCSEGKFNLNNNQTLFPVILLIIISY